MEMEMWVLMRPILVMIIITMLWRLEGTYGIRFELDKEECVSYKAETEGDVLHYSFVLIKSDTNFVNDKGVDLVVKGPSGEQLHDMHDKTSEKNEIMVYKEGLYQFCFVNNSPYLVVIDFDVHHAHLTSYDQHATDEHFAPLMDQISRLEEALYGIEFEQHWLEAQTDRQAIVSEDMGRRAMHKAMFESAALIATSILQMYLMRRLFNRKLGFSRV